MWHKKWKGKTKEQVEIIERKPYEEFGYKVLHIWEDEIVEEYRSGRPRFFENQSKVIEKIRTFNL